MKFRYLFLTVSLAAVMSSCRSVPKTAMDDGRVPDTVRPDDAVAVDTFQKKGGKGGWLPAKDTFKEALTPKNSGFVIDLDAQRAYLYQGSQLIAFSPIASGRKYYRTETGDYTIGQKDLNHRSTSYGNFVGSSGSTVMSDVQNGFDPVPVGARFEGSLMKYFLRLYHKGRPTAMGLHRGVLPGYPASHGCIRLPGTMAAWFFQNVQLGTPVAVRGTKLGIPIGKSQGRPRRAPKVHPSLKETPVEPQVPPAPEAEIKTPEPDVTSPPASDPTAVPPPVNPASPAPAPDSAAAPAPTTPGPGAN